MEYQVGDYVEVKPMGDYSDCCFRGTIISLYQNNNDEYPVCIDVEESYNEDRFVQDQVYSGYVDIAPNEIAGLVNGSKHKRIPTVFLEGIEL